MGDAEAARTGRVLVIEDDPDVARAITTVLRGGRLEVLAAGDGRPGLHAPSTPGGPSSSCWTSACR